MSDFGGEIKGKSRLAVFEHVVENDKKTSKRKRRYSEDSSQSEPEMVIGNLPVPKSKGLSLKDEILNLECAWNSCYQNFAKYDEFVNHVLGHSEDSLDNFDCQWKNCPNPEIDSQSSLVNHLSYHSYLKKLENIGDNIAKRDNLPDCLLNDGHQIIVSDYACEWDDCKLWFGSITDFLYHIISHVQGVPSKSKKCDIACEWIGCNTKVSTRWKMTEHVRVHTKERYIACSKCGAMFVTKTTFSEHRKRQLKSNLRRYQCSQCLKLFPTERILSDHMRTHINQYKCTMCDMTSSKPSELAKHYRYRHINHRPFKCHLCEKTFVGKCNLNTHLLTHQDKPFKCQMCPEGFKSKVGLNSHIEKKHSKETRPKYQCHVCNLSMSRGDNLTQHLMKKHKFHWPSGHSRFRYRKDQDGICRLQTVRYESIEVTEEMIKSESTQKQNKLNSAFTYYIEHDSSLKDGYKVTVIQDGENGENITTDNMIDITNVPEKQNPQNSNAEILITIEDVNEEGEVIKSQLLKSSLVVCSSKEERCKKKRPRNEQAAVRCVGRSLEKLEDSQDQTELPQLKPFGNSISNHKTNVKRLNKADLKEDMINRVDDISFDASNLTEVSVIANCDKDESNIKLDDENNKFPTNSDISLDSGSSNLSEARVIATCDKDESIHILKPVNIDNIKLDSEEIKNITKTGNFDISLDSCNSSNLSQESVIANWNHDENFQMITPINMDDIKLDIEDTKISIETGNFDMSVDSFSSNLSQGSVILMCDKEESIQVLKPIEFVEVKTEMI